MPNWRKLIVSGSDASLNSLNVTQNVTAQSFTGSLFGTASFAVTASYALTASFVSGSVNITNNTDNFLLTATGTPAINGEANATFNGSTLAITGTVTSTLDSAFNSVSVGKGGGSIITNTRVGNSALAANTTGVVNTAVGNYSMLYNTSGRSNTAVGKDSLRFNLVGSNNTALGNVALRDNLASNNTAVAFNNTSTGIALPTASLIKAKRLGLVAADAKLNLLFLKSDM